MLPLLFDANISWIIIHKHLVFSALVRREHILNFFRGLCVLSLRVIVMVGQLGTLGKPGVTNQWNAEVKTRLTLHEFPTILLYYYTKIIY